MPKKNKWIQGATSKKTKGALHRQLGITQNEKIPKKTLQDIVTTDVGKKTHGITVTKLVKHRATFALNAQKRRK